MVQNSTSTDHVNLEEATHELFTRAIMMLCLMVQILINLREPDF
jgi:hypothetical protein